MAVVGAVAAVAGAYVCGALPFAVWIGRAKGLDLRTVGSGNPGGSNVARALSWRWGALVVGLDVVKAAVPAFVGERVGGPWLGVACATAAVAGSLASPFLRFRGGKGGATAGGASFGLMPLVGVCLFVVWQVAYRLSGGYASVGTVAGAVAYPLLAWALGEPLPYILFATAASALVVFRHRANLMRLRRGEELPLRRRPVIKGD